MTYMYGKEAAEAIEIEELKALKAEVWETIKDLSSAAFDQIPGLREVRDYVSPFDADAQAILARERNEEFERKVRSAGYKSYLLGWEDT